ncbi:MAG: fumarate hydratase [Victivallaceae bacterium]|nr:fumarate hydratase [Victivallaceae bacterium]
MAQAKSMRLIPFEKIASEVATLCIRANSVLPDDVHRAIEQAYARESNPLAKGFLNEYLQNAEIAATEQEALCQDTGFAVFFIEMGEDCAVSGGSLSNAIEEGIRRGYRDGFLRKSIVSDPLFHRINTKDNTPGIIHLTLVPGDQLSITLAPKGGGSENMSAIRMLKPSDGKQGVLDFVVECVRAAGGCPCPPTVVGVGIGGTFEKAAYLAKKALLRDLAQSNSNPDYAALEQEILDKLNQTGVGAQGLGGDVTSFAVHIEFFPCHIASLPVAVNLNCHAARHASITL